MTRPFNIVVSSMAFVLCRISVFLSGSAYSRKLKIADLYIRVLLQENIRRCVCIIYDPSRSNQGVLALKALKLSDSFMDLYRNNNFTGEKYVYFYYAKNILWTWALPGNLILSFVLIGWERKIWLGWIFLRKYQYVYNSSSDCYLK